MIVIILQSFAFIRWNHMCLWLLLAFGAIVPGLGHVTAG